MSQCSNHVKWCLKKAEKEIDECRKLKKLIKHRGLIKVEPDKKAAEKHILKAGHNLRAVNYFNKGGFSDWSITAGFYCMYHCFLAIALNFGYQSRNQGCTVAVVEMLNEEGKVKINEKFIEMLKSEGIEERHENTVIELREEYTYGIKLIAEKNEVEELVDDCKELIDTVKDIVSE